jgi:galactokinase/mevalonate kinase-like predicted kinase
MAAPERSLLLYFAGKARDSTDIIQELARNAHDKT